MLLLRYRRLKNLGQSPLIHLTHGLHHRKQEVHKHKLVCSARKKVVKLKITWQLANRCISEEPVSHFKPVRQEGRTYLNLTGVGRNLRAQ